MKQIHDFVVKWCDKFRNQNINYIELVDYYMADGSFCADFDYEGTDLSDLVRDTTGMDDLYVFDGNCKPDVINKITLDYHRVTKVKPGQRPEGATWEFVTWDYTEHLIIDRETETLEHIQNIGTGCRVSFTFL